MPKRIIRRRLSRLLVDASNYTTFRDSLTGQEPLTWRGNMQRMDVALAEGLASAGLTSDDQLMDLSGSGLESLTLEVKDAADPTHSNLMAKTTTAFDNTLTADTWNDGTKAHATFLFSDSEANIPPATYVMIISGITADGPFTFGVTRFTVKEDGTPGDVAAPATNPGSAISLGQADGRYLTASPDGPSIKHGARPAGSTGATSLALVFPTAFASPASLVQVQLMPPAGGAGIAAWVEVDTITETGCNVVYGAALPGSTYSLSWVAFA